MKGEAGVGRPDLAAAEGNRRRSGEGSGEQKKGDKRRVISGRESSNSGIIMKGFPLIYEHRTIFKNTVL